MVSRLDGGRLVGEPLCVVCLGGESKVVTVRDVLSSAVCVRAAQEVVWLHALHLSTVLGPERRRCVRLCEPWVARVCAGV